MCSYLNRNQASHKKKLNTGADEGRSSDALSAGSKNSLYAICSHKERSVNEAKGKIKAMLLELTEQVRRWRHKENGGNKCQHDTRQNDGA